MNYERATADQLRSLDKAHHLHPMTDHKSMYESGGSRMFSHAEGCYIYDNEGRRYLDGFAGLASVGLGYGREELVEAAAGAMRELSYASSFFNATHPLAVQLASELAELAPEGISRAFFGNSGSDANDTALRIVRYYWELRGNLERQVVIALNHGYHGSTTAGAALSGASLTLERGGAFDNIVHIPPAYQFEHGRGMSPEGFGLLAASWLEDAIVKAGPDRVAAFWFEPFLGAGGGKMPPPNYLPEVERICRKYDVLLVADEVVSGLGRSGDWWSSQTLGPIRPDLICLAKGITSSYVPLSAVMVSDSIADVIVDKGGDFHHGFTYSGHPVSCAVALATLRIMKEERILERVKGLLPHFEERLARLASSRIVGEVRNVGLFGAFELVADRDTLTPIEDPMVTCEKFREIGLQEGIIVRPCASTVVLAPPLVITAKEVDELFDGIERALRRFEQHIAMHVDA